MTVWALFAALLVLFSGISGHCDNAPQRAAPVAERVSREAVMRRLLQDVRASHGAGTLILTRKVWPRSVPIAIEIGQWFRHESGGYYYHVEFADCNQHVFATGSILNPLMPTQRRSIGWGHDGTFEIPTDCVEPDGHLEVNIRFADTTREGRFTTDAERLPFTIGLADSIEDVMQPVAEDEVIGRLAKTIRVFPAGHRRGGPPDAKAALGVILPTDLPADIAIGIRIDVLDGDHVLATARICVTTRKFRRNAGLGANQNRETFIIPVDTDTPLNELLPIAKARPMVARISPDPEYALRDFDNDRYLHWDEPFVVDVDTSALEPVE